MLLIYIVGFSFSMYQDSYSGLGKSWPAYKWELTPSFFFIWTMMNYLVFVLLSLSVFLKDAVTPYTIQERKSIAFHLSKWAPNWSHFSYSCFFSLCDLFTNSRDSIPFLFFKNAIWLQPCSTHSLGLTEVPWIKERGQVGGCEVIST